MMQRPRISFWVFILLFFFLGFIPGIIYVIIKGNEVSKYDAMMATMAAQQRPAPPPGNQEPTSPDPATTPENKEPTDQQP